MTEARILPSRPIESFDDYRAAGGGRGIDAADLSGPVGIIEEVSASGLRGRGGAGFPTGRKWVTVAANQAPDALTTVVVNGAEGEPGSFKDRAILRANPFAVVEGALIAARAVRADRIVVALGASFVTEQRRATAAIEGARAAGWCDGIEIEVVLGSDEYLYGEETALLEVLDGRPPFPRIAPPYRRGVDDEPDETKSAADVDLASPGGTEDAPPALVNNTETLANVPGILARGAGWFRGVGTSESPGTVVCTVTGATRRHGVGEFALGTPLANVIDELGGGPEAGRRVVAVLSGVANAMLPAELLATPISHEALRAAGSGLGAAGFIVFDDATDLVSVAHGVARFLAVESCGQCTPCKEDGLAIADLLDRFRRSETVDLDLASLADHVATVTDEARCNLALQQQAVIGSVLQRFPDALRRHLDGAAPAAEPYLVAPIVDFEGDRAVLDANHAAKQPDWTYGETWSGQAPADRYELGTLS